MVQEGFKAQDFWKNRVFFKNEESWLVQDHDSNLNIPALGVKGFSINIEEQEDFYNGIVYKIFFIVLIIKSYGLNNQVL